MVADLSPEDKATIAEAFKQLDYNGDGVIEKHEILLFLKSTGLSPESAEQRAVELIRAMDRDGDGKIDLSEFTYGKTADKLASDASLIDSTFKS